MSLNEHIVTFKKKGIDNLKVYMVSENFESMQEFLSTNDRREVIKGREDYRRKVRESFTGVSSYEEALSLARHGYKDAIDQVKIWTESKIRTMGKTTSFKNDIVGYTPIVPLYLVGVPNCMLNTTRTEKLTKTFRLYLDMSYPWYYKLGDIRLAGSGLMAAVQTLQQQGYRCDIYAMFMTLGHTSRLKNGYSTEFEKEMPELKGYIPANCVTIKLCDSSQRIDLNRLSFFTSHTAAARIFAFDWASRVDHNILLESQGYCMYNHICENYSVYEIRRFTNTVFGSNTVILSTGALLEHMAKLKKKGKDIDFADEVTKFLAVHLVTAEESEKERLKRIKLAKLRKATEGSDKKPYKEKKKFEDYIKDFKDGVDITNSGTIE